MMNQTLKAILLEIKPGAVYEGAMYDCHLLVQVAGGVVLELFDAEALAPHLDLQTGKEYEFFVVADIVRNLQLTPLPAGEENRNGTIRDLTWNPPEEEGFFRAQHSRLANRTYIQVALPWGIIYLIRSKSREPFWSTATPDSPVAWQAGRWDLFAVK